MQFGVIPVDLNDSPLNAQMSVSCSLKEVVLETKGLKNAQKIIDLSWAGQS